jgi:hypothetical protein
MNVSILLGHKVRIAISKKPKSSISFFKIPIIANWPIKKTKKYS